jgi:hypothetical protein
MVAKTNLVSNVLTGEVLVNVENSFHYRPGQEIVLIDYGYNEESSPHYHIYEYAQIKEVNNTHWITLSSPVESTTGWLVSNNAFIQKTIGHSILYSDRIYYGDREVIPTEEMAITVEPVSLSNEWIYIHGGLSEEYRILITIYGKDIETEEGMKILNLYSDAVYDLFNRNIHIDINNHFSPLLEDVSAGSNMVIVEDNATNREYFRISTSIPDDEVYEVQDNNGIEIDLYCTNVVTPGDGRMYVYLNLNNPTLYGIQPLERSYSLSEYAVFMRHGTRYFYDSRIDGVDYGKVQKGSAFLRAATLNWFGKEVTEYQFPQQSHRLNYFKAIEYSSSSSS